MFLKEMRAPRTSPHYMLHRTQLHDGRHDVFYLLYGLSRLQRSEPARRKAPMYGFDATFARYASVARLSRARAPRNSNIHARSPSPTSAHTAKLSIFYAFYDDDDSRFAFITTAFIEYHRRHESAFGITVMMPVGRSMMADIDIRFTLHAIWR